METFRILVNLHHMPGASAYELSLLIAAGSLLLQYLCKRRGNKEAAILFNGLTLIGLGVVYVESIMRMLRLMAAIII